MLAESARRLRRTTTIPSTSMGGGEGAVTAVQYDILIFFYALFLKKEGRKKKINKEIKKKLNMERRSTKSRRQPDEVGHGCRAFINDVRARVCA